MRDTIPAWFKLQIFFPIWNLICDYLLKQKSIHGLQFASHVQIMDFILM